MMGPNKAHWRWISAYNQPRHKVTLSGYSISKYPVTFAEYDLYTKITQKPWLSPEYLRIHYFARGPKHPVQWVTWYQANTYCHWLAQKSGLPYDLPTEAQWEYAARSRGLEINWATDNGQINPGRNTPDAKDVNAQKGKLPGYDPEPLPVGSFPPNPLGIYDMDGSVAQWAKNWFYTYPNHPETNPEGPRKGIDKVIRSGGFQGNSSFQGPYFRDKMKPSRPFGGFRCVVDLNHALGKESSHP